MAEIPESNPISLTADIVSSYVTNNAVPAADLPGLIRSTYEALAAAANPTAPADAAPSPAVSIRKSVHHDYLISLEDGRQYKALARHLRRLGLSPEEYRAKWGLPRDYPMVCAAYSEQRSAMAKAFGLGRNGRGGAPEAVATTAPKGRRGVNGKAAVKSGKGVPIKPQDETFT